MSCALEEALVEVQVYKYCYWDKTTLVLLLGLQLFSWGFQLHFTARISSTQVVFCCGFLLTICSWSYSEISTLHLAYYCCLKLQFSYYLAQDTTVDNYLFLWLSWSYYWHFSYTKWSLPLLLVYQLTNLLEKSGLLLVPKLHKLHKLVELQVSLTSWQSDYSLALGRSVTTWDHSTVWLNYQPTFWEQYQLGSPSFLNSYKGLLTDP